MASLNRIPVGILSIRESKISKSIIYTFLYNNDYHKCFLDISTNTISKCEHGDVNIEELLDGPVCHSGFERLN